MSRAKELTQNTIVITIGRISTQFVTFLLLPLYTSLLSTKEYGTADLMIAIVQLLIPIASLMIDQGVFRYLLNCQSIDEQRTTISSAFFILSFLGLISIFLYAAISRFIYNQYNIWIILILIATSYSNFFLQIARGLKRINAYAIGSFICSATTIAFNILFIVFTNLRTAGILMATLLGNTCCCILLALNLRLMRYISFKQFDIHIAKQQLIYSIPLVPNQLSLWIMNCSDRLIVAFFLGTAANGILAISHKFPSIFMTFFGIFLLAWQETGTTHFFDEDRDSFFSDILRKTVLLFSSLCMGIMVVLPLVFDFIINPAFSDAYYQIPIYLMAFFFNVVIGMLGVVYIATKKTAEIAKTTIMAAAVNLGVNFLLINVIGLYAASVSTFVGYFLTMIYRIMGVKQYLSLKYSKKHCVIIGIAFAICSFVYYCNSKILTICFIPCYILYVVYFNKDMLSVIINIARKRVC